MINERIARKLGTDIVTTLADITLVPKDNVKRFLVLKKRLAKQIDRYKEYTGRDTLSPEIVAYAQRQR